MRDTKLSFPKRFLWGASVAAHQVEGNNHNQWSVWELENAKASAARAEYQYNDLDVWPDIKKEAKRPDNYVSGAASNHWEQYETDFDIARKLNLNALRFSVEWSRIEPTEGSWNVEAIEHYRQYIKALKQRGIEPMMTLLHFTVPVWFAEKGGFEKRRNVKYFLRFVEKTVSELGKDIRYIITINEPEVYATESYYLGNWPPQRRSKWLWWRVVHNQLYAHKKAAKLIHASNRRYKVSIAKNSNYFYPGDDAWLTRVSAHVAQYFQDDYFLKKAYRHCDFIGVNYYFSNRVYGYRVHNPEQKLSDLGWDMQPENLEYVLERLHRKYKKPLIVTENGLADRDDADRKWWLTKTIMAMQQAIDEGVDLVGYFHWSLLDNFEWAHGKWPEFGLVHVDYTTNKRQVRPSAAWFALVLKKLQETSK